MAAGPDSSGYLAEAERLAKAGRWEEERAVLSRAIAAFPKDPEPWMRYAVVWAEDDPAAAATHARQAVELAGDDPAILARAASLTFNLHDYEASERYLRRALPLVPEEFPLIPDMLHLAGRLALQKGNQPVSEEYLRHAFEIEPGSLGFGRVLAVMLAARGPSREPRRDQPRACTRSARRRRAPRVARRGGERDLGGRRSARRRLTGRAPFGIESLAACAR